MTDEVTLRAIDGVNLSDINDMAPTYQLGFAVRADADAWLDLLRYSQATELFRNALHQTARHYAALLAKAVRRSSKGASTDLALIPLPADIPSHLKKKFADTVRDQLGSNTGVYSDALKLWSEHA